MNDRFPYGFVLNENNTDVVYGKDIQQNSNNVMDKQDLLGNLCTEFSDLGDGLV